MARIWSEEPQEEKEKEQEKEEEKEEEEEEELIHGLELLCELDSR